MKYFMSLLVGLGVSFAVPASEPLSEQVLIEKAKGFIEAKNARQQPDTRITDIDYFISLLSDDFIDEHIKFNVTVSDKAKLRAGMLKKMQDKVVFSSIHIEQMMVGRNVVFVKYTEHAKVHPSHLDKEIEYTSTNILSLEFNDEGLIHHIRRHHGL